MVWWFIVLYCDVLDEMQSMTGQELHNSNQFGNAWTVSDEDRPVSATDCCLCIGSFFNPTINYNNSNNYLKSSYTIKSHSVVKTTSSKCYSVGSCGSQNTGIWKYVVKNDLHISFSQQLRPIPVRLTNLFIVFPVPWLGSDNEHV